MSALLSPRFWIGLALCAMLAFSHLSAYRAGRGAVRAAWDRERAEMTAQALAASEAARAKEQALTVANQKVSEKYAAEKKRSATAAANLAVSLRQLEDTLASPIGANSTASTVDHGTGGVERELLGECARYFASMAITADQCQAKTIALQDYIKSVVQAK